MQVVDFGRQLLAREVRVVAEIPWESREETSPGAY